MRATITWIAACLALGLGIGALVCNITVNDRLARIEHRLDVAEGR